MRPALLTLFLATAAFSQETPQSLITARCQICHNDDTPSGGLSLASMARMRKGGAHGPALIPGKPDESLLYKLISGIQPAMPRSGGPLTPDQIASIRRWITKGAPWVDSAKWWSLQPLSKPALPVLHNARNQNVSENAHQAVNPIDAFILAKLEEKRLVPNPEADRRTLIRRLTYDLHGLPPSPAEVDAFVADPSPEAYEHLVDRLLASPRYGERWGRHWLDVAHYGESHGYDKDKPRRNACPIATT